MCGSDAHPFIPWKGPLVSPHDPALPLQVYLPRVFCPRRRPSPGAAAQQMAAWLINFNKSNFN